MMMVYQIYWSRSLRKMTSKSFFLAKNIRKSRREITMDLIVLALPSFKYLFTLFPQSSSPQVDSKSKEQTFEGSDSNLFFLALNQLVGLHEKHWCQFWPSWGLLGVFFGPREALFGPKYPEARFGQFCNTQRS